MSTYLSLNRLFWQLSLFLFCHVFSQKKMTTSSTKTSVFR